MAPRAARLCRLPDVASGSGTHGKLQGGDGCAWTMEKGGRSVHAWDLERKRDVVHAEATEAMVDAHVAMRRGSMAVAACLESGRGRIWTKLDGKRNTVARKVEVPADPKTRRNERERLVAVHTARHVNDAKSHVLFGTSGGKIVHVELDERGEPSKPKVLERGQGGGVIQRIGSLLWKQQEVSPIKQLAWREKDGILVALDNNELQVWTGDPDDLNSYTLGGNLNVQAHFKQELDDNCEINNFCLVGKHVFVLARMQRWGLCVLDVKVDRGIESYECQPSKLYKGLAKGFWSGAASRRVVLRCLLPDTENPQSVPEYLLLGSEGRVLTCLGSSVQKFTSCYEKPVLDACPSKTHTSWLLLDPSAGVMSVPMQTLSRQQWAVDADMASATRMGELALDELRHALAQGRDMDDPDKAADLRARLMSLGAFTKAESNPFLTLGKEIVDTLFKHWGGEDASLANMGGQLLDKKNRFNAYLELLSWTGCFDLLKPESLSTLFALAMKIEFLLALREAENLLSTNEHPALSFLRECLGLAGEEIKSFHAALAARPPEEVVYSRASSCDYLLVALQKTFANRFQTAQEAATGWGILEASTACVLTAVESSSETWKYISERFPSAFAYATGGSSILPWLGSKRVIGMLASTTEAVLNATNALSAVYPEHVPAARGRLLELASQLLDSHRLAVESASIGSDTQQSLFREYAATRDRQLAALLEHALDDGGQEAIDAVASLAVRHHGYACLAQLCDTIGSEEMLFDYMRNLESSAQFDGKFCTFYFQWLLDRKRDFELMHLPSEFDEELLGFIQPLLRLRWLQEIKMRKHAAASHTLEVLSKENGLSLEQSYRRLSLQKLSLLASGQDHSSEKVCDVDSALTLLDIQTKISIGSNKDPIMSPVEMVDAALQETAPSKLSLAFAVFAAAGDGFRRSHLKRLEAAWRAAADVTDWEELANARVGESDESYVGALQQTAVHQAAVYCYASRSFCAGAPFSDTLNIDEVFTLLQEHTALEEYPLETLRHALFTATEGMQVVDT